METSEFLNALLATFGQGVESFKDGAQPDDAGDFVDEAFTWPNAIKGLGGAWRNEALQQTPETIEMMFAGEKEKLISRGLLPMEAHTIITGLNAVYSTYCSAVQRSDRRNTEPVDPGSAIADAQEKTGTTDLSS